MKPWTPDEHLHLPGELFLECTPVGPAENKRWRWALVHREEQIERAYTQQTIASGRLDAVDLATAQAAAIAGAEAYCEARIAGMRQALVELRRRPERGERLRWEERRTGEWQTKFGAAPLVVRFEVVSWNGGKEYRAEADIGGRVISHFPERGSLAEAQADCEQWLADWLKQAGVQ
jgi:hypothetical protein